MDLEPHIETVREQLALAAEAGGEEARAVAQRLTAPLESALRLMLLDVLAAAAAEITRELAPGSVELRLRTGSPEFVVSAPSIDLDQGVTEQTDHTQAFRSGTAETPLGAGEGGVARVNLRLPDQLKSRVERAADREGLSINAWLMRAAAAAVQRAESGGQEPQAPRGGQRYSGWGR
jgi:hypothetical protein